MCKDTGEGPEQHGMSKTRIYRLWREMRCRCYYPKHAHYPDYGGRGITVCDSWRNSFSAFYKAMGERPGDLTLDRIDNNRGYSPENCRWASRSAQQHNKRLDKRNKTAITGVRWRRKDRLWAAEIGGKYLGASKDFFEMCCLRKSAEARRQELGSC